METKERIVILLAMGLLAAGAAQSSEKPARRISNTRTASCLVKITCDPAILPLDITLVDALLQSTGVRGNAVREVLGISPDIIQDFDRVIIQLEEIHSTSLYAPAKTTVRRTGESTAQSEARRRAEAAARARAHAAARSGTGASNWSELSNLVNEESILVRLHIIIDDNEIKPAAEELMDRIIYNLRSSLLKVFDDHKNRLNEHLAVADGEAARTSNGFREMQEELRELSGTNDLDRNRIINDMKELRTAIDSIEMNQVSDEIIIDGISKQIAKIEEKTKAQLADDEITNELLKMLDTQTQNLHNTKKLIDLGQAGASDLTDAEEKLARARIELAQRREELSKSAGGNLIESFNERLAEISIKTAQDRAHLSNYLNKLNEKKRLLKIADDYELLSLRTDMAKENLREVLEWRDKVGRQVRMLQPPAVSVLGGE